MSKTFSNYFGLRIGLRLHLVWSLRKSRSNRRRKCSSDYFAINCFWFYSNLTRRDAAKRLRFRLWCIIIHCGKYLRKYCMENFKSNHYKIIIRNLILRISDCFNSFANNKTLKGRRVISSILQIFKSKSFKLTGHYSSLLLSHLFAGLQSRAKISP